MNPDCNYSTGNHYWKAGVINDGCYVDANLSTNPTFNVTGQLKNNLTLPVFNSNHNVTDQIPINFTTLSDCSNDIAAENPVINTTYSIEISLNESSWDTCSAANSYNGWYNCTWNSIAKQEGSYSVRVNTSKTGQFYSNSSTYGDWFNLLNWNVSNTTVP